MIEEEYFQRECGNCGRTKDDGLVKSDNFTAKSISGQQSMLAKEMGHCSETKGGI